MYGERRLNRSGEGGLKRARALFRVRLKALLGHTRPGKALKWTTRKQST